MPHFGFRDFPKREARTEATDFCADRPVVPKLPGSDSDFNPGVVRGMAQERAGRKMRRFAGAVFALAAMPTSVAQGDSLAITLRTPLEAHTPAKTEGAYVFAEWERGAQVGAGPIVTDVVIADRIDHLKEISPSFRRSWDDLRIAGVPILIGSSDQLSSLLSPDLAGSPDWAGLTLTWTEGPENGLDRAAVVVRVQEMRDLHGYFGNPQRAFIETLDDVLMREIYGNLLPTVSP